MCIPMHSARRGTREPDVALWTRPRMAAGVARRTSRAGRHRSRKGPGLIRQRTSTASNARRGAWRTPTDCSMRQPRVCSTIALTCDAYVSCYCGTLGFSRVAATRKLGFHSSGAATEVWVSTTRSVESIRRPWPLQGRPTQEVAAELKTLEVQVVRARCISVPTAACARVTSHGAGLFADVRSRLSTTRSRSSTRRP